LNITLPLTNSGGTVSEQGGVMSLLDTTNVTHTGTFDVASGKFLDFSAGTHNLAAGASLTGTGTFKIAGATLNANTNVSATNLGILTGTLGGTGNVTTTGTLTWNGGTTNSSARTNVPGRTEPCTTG